MRLLIFVSLLFFGYVAQSQNTPKEQDTLKTLKANPFVTGYYPIAFFDVDLKYLVKYNNYEAFRLGFGGVTNERLFKKIKIGGYVAYGFKDQAFKYSVGGNYLLSKKNKSWLSAYYTDDISEIGTFNYLTNARSYSVFEPRLLNITQFYKHKTWHGALVQEFSPKLFSEIRVSRSAISQIEDYSFIFNNRVFKDYVLSEGTISAKYSPSPRSFISEEGKLEKYDGFPTLSGQITQGFDGITGSDFNYTKIGGKLDYFIKRQNLSSSHFILEGVKAFGAVPLTHLFHAEPNSPTKDEILQRFSVAGTQSFETMYFGEFFSSELITFRGKHTLQSFKISRKIKPELVFITKHAIGNLDQPERHIGLPFNTLEQLYSESGLELNQLLFGFGLSFAYRYGFYHLPKFEDNISFKFTFHIKV